MSEMVYLPNQYRWVAPRIEMQVADEPDSAEANVSVLYDYWAGRLGSDTSVSVGGSDDGTVHRARINTEVTVELAGLPQTIHQLVATSAWECQGTFADITSEHDEYGVSDVQFSWTSKPYASLEGQAKGFSLPVASFYESSATGSDGPFSSAEVVRSIQLEIQAGHPEGREFKFNDVAYERVVRLVVGLEDEVRVSSNDWSYTARLHSHWLLRSITVGVA